MVSQHVASKMRWETNSSQDFGRCVVYDPSKHVAAHRQRIVPQIGNIIGKGCVSFWRGRERLCAYISVHEKAKEDDGEWVPKDWLHQGSRCCHRYSPSVSGQMGHEHPLAVSAASHIQC